MDEETIKAILEQAIGDLFANQPNISEFTPETGETEWNLAHHLALEIRKFFPWYDCDLDVTKGSSGNKRPDIILHKRGTHDFNLLVIEAKYEKGQAELRHEIDKIKEHWFASHLHYQFGAVINLRRDKIPEVEVIKNASQESATEAPTRQPS